MRGSSQPECIVRSSWIDSYITILRGSFFMSGVPCPHLSRQIDLGMRMQGFPSKLYCVLWKLDRSSENYFVSSRFELLSLSVFSNCRLTDMFYHTDKLFPVSNVYIPCILRFLVIICHFLSSIFVTTLWIGDVAKSRVLLHCWINGL